MYELEEQTHFDYEGRPGIFFLRQQSTDYDTVNAIWRHDEYGIKDIPLRNGDTVIDAGAHIGAVAVLFEIRPQKLRIIAIEPLQENVEMLEKNIKLNAKNPVEVAALALAGKIGKIKIHYNDGKDEVGVKHRFIGSGYVRKDCSFAEVDGKTIEQFFYHYKIEHCRILKLDIEGLALEALNSTPPEILAKIDYIIGEHHYEFRRDLFAKTKGLFEDLPCPYQSEEKMGHFRFKRKGI